MKTGRKEATFATTTNRTAGGRRGIKSCSSTCLWPPPPPRPTSNPIPHRGAAVRWPRLRAAKSRGIGRNPNQCQYTAKNPVRPSVFIDRNLKYIHRILWEKEGTARHECGKITKSSSTYSREESPLTHETYATFHSFSRGYKFGASANPPKKASPPDVHKKEDPFIHFSPQNTNNASSAPFI